MAQEIKTISLSLPLGLGKVNCYLVKTDTGFVLIDTGLDRQRAGLERELGSAGCKPGNLQLIVLTHGDTDHSGNAAYLRQKYRARIAAHPAELQVVERGNMTLSRNHLSFLQGRALSLVGLGKSDRFKPDLYVEDGQDISAYGLDARVIHIPGHSNGSIGLLTRSGDLFCGDLLINSGGPRLNSIMDHLPSAQASVEKLSALEIKTVYPGHGEPFPMDLFLKSYREDKKG